MILNQKIMKNFLLMLAFLTTVFAIFKEREISKLEVKLKESQKISDSLKSEIFASEIQLSRYENTLEILKEQNPETAEVFENTMSQETE